MKEGFTVWFTGLPGSGKTTLSNALAKALADDGYVNADNIVSLDGNIVREGLCSDLGFTKECRKENVRRIRHVAKYLMFTGKVVLVSCIAPYRSSRQMTRWYLYPNYLEVFCNTPLSECIRRDPRGLYKKAQAGEVKHFTGISDPYEEPQEGDGIDMPTGSFSIRRCATSLVNILESKGLI